MTERLLDDAEKRIIAQIIHNIILASYQLKLYEKENSLCLQSIDTVTGFIDLMAKKHGAVTLSEKDNKLLLDGNPFVPVKEEAVWSRNFAMLMMNSEIKSVRFLPGITFDELRILLKGFNRKKGLKGIVEELNEVKDKHISLNTELYREPVEQELIVEKTQEPPAIQADVSVTPAETPAASDDIITTIKKAAEMAASAGTPEKRSEAKNAVIGRLLTIDIPSLINLIRKDLPLDVEKVLEESIGSLSEEKLKEITGDMMTRYALMRSTSEILPDRVSKEDLSAFRDIFHKFTLWLKNQNIILDIYQLAMEKKAEEIVPQWFRPEGDLTQKEELLELVSELLKVDGAMLLTTENGETVKKAFEQLSSLGENKLLKQLANKLADNFRSKDRNIRTKTSALIKTAFDSIEDLGSRDVTRFLAGRLRDIAFEEPDTPVFNNVAECIKKEINQDILEGNYDDAVKLIGVYKTQSVYGKKNLNHVIKTLIEAENIPLVIGDLGSEKKDLRESALEILIRMKEFFIPEIMKAAADTEDLRRRKQLLALMKSLGDRGLTEVISYISAEKPVSEVINIVQVIDSISPSKFIFEKIRSLYSHFDHRIRREVVLCMERINSDESKEVITTALADPHPLARVEAIKAAGSLKLRTALPSLHEMIKPRSVLINDSEEDLQVEACITLGMIKDTSSVQPLVECIFPQASDKNKIERTRAAAVRALGHIVTPESKTTLENALRSENKLIKDSATEALLNHSRQKEQTTRAGTALL